MENFSLHHPAVHRASKSTACLATQTQATHSPIEANRRKQYQRRRWSCNGVKLKETWKGVGWVPFRNLWTSWATWPNRKGKPLQHLCDLPDIYLVMTIHICWYVTYIHMRFKSCFVFIKWKWKCKAIENHFFLFKKCSWLEISIIFIQKIIGTFFYA